MLFFLFLLLAASAEEIYDDSDKCDTTTSTDGLILTLNCSNRNLHHVLASWPAAAPNATTISATFAGNNITTLATLPPTDAVLEVSFARCHIQYLYPGVFGNAKNTKIADFSHNLLTAEQITRETLVGPYRNAQTKPVQLEILDLSYNQIHSLGKDVFEHLPRLQRLNLEGNDFRVLDIHTQLALSSLTGLLSLNLANNELTELVRGAVEGFQHLTELDLSTNQLDFVPRDLHLVGGTLEVLILDGNPILELEETSFSGLDNLLELSANNLTRLQEIPAKSLAPLHNLKKLSLAQNAHLKTIDREAFAENLTLLELYLNDNNLTNIDSHLVAWSKLHIFEFNENPLHCSCDLYNITSALSRDITVNADGPRCLDPTGRSAFVFGLRSDICLKGVFSFAASRGRYLHRHFSIPLAGLVAVLVLAIFVAVTLAYSRYRRFLRNKNYPFASQVLYNPLSTAMGRC